MIRDAEIENTIRAYATPVFLAAGLEPSSINIYLVKDPSLNAFVAGGQNLFINTGLLTKSANPGQIIGVIAHEVGHIAGGHLSRTHAALSKSSAPAILAYILAGAATLATGRADVGSAIALGGQSASLRNFLSYSRGQEASADHAALKYLDSTKQSAQGLVEFMRLLEDQELLSTASQDPYIRSHPLSRDRIATLENHVKNSPYSNIPPTDVQVETHARLRAKLSAFLDSPSRSLRLFKASDKSVATRYARAIAYYRKSQIDDALALMNELISDFPNDPYFHELKGQALFENGRIKEALVSYQKSVDILADAFLIRRELARVQLESHDPSLIDPAISNLRIALPKEPRSSYTWHLLAIAYGRKGDVGRSSLALAEEALLQGKPSVATYQAGRAERLFDKGTREWLQSQDILIAAREIEKKQNSK